MSTWLGHGMATHLDIAGCALESVGWVQQMVLLTVGEYHPKCWGPEYNKKRSKVELAGPDCLSWCDSSPDLSAPGSQAFQLYLQLSQAPAYRWSIMGLLSLHNCSFASFCPKLDLFLLSELWNQHRNTTTCGLHIGKRVRVESRRCPSSPSWRRALWIF